MSDTIVEHNDVDISPLFTWSKEFEIIYGETKTPVFMRILGDADMNKARVAALRKSAELRRKLKDTDSDERLAFIKDIDDIDLETILSLITVFSMRDLAELAATKLKIKLPTAPRSDAKTSAHEKYQTAIDAYPDKRQEELKGLINKEIDSLKEKLLLNTKEENYNKYVSSMIDEMCEQELLREFKSQCAYLGTYKNRELTERLFQSYDKFSNLDSNLKLQFLSEYSDMELRGDDLKKLQQVTP